MVDKDNFAFCGINCKECEMGNETFSKAAKDLHELVDKFELKKWYDKMPCDDNENFNFEEFEKGVKWMEKWTNCPTCKGGGGPPECKIRICCKENNREGCWVCNEVNTCDKLTWLEEAGLKDIRKKIKKLKD